MLGRKSRDAYEEWTHVRDTGDGSALEVVLVKLLNSGSKVGSSLVLDETLTARAGGIALTVDLTVDNVQSRLAREVLEVLERS